MTESRTSIHEIDTVSDDNFSWDFVNNASDSVSLDNFNGRWFMICFFGIISIIVGGVIYLSCRIVKGEKGEEDNNSEIEPDFIISQQRNCDEVIKRNKEETIWCFLF